MERVIDALMVYVFGLMLIFMALALTAAAIAGVVVLWMWAT